MSSTTTNFFRCAAVPQDPTLGPIFTPSTSDKKSFGKRGPAPPIALKQSSESISNTEAIESMQQLSTKRHRLSRISLSGCRQQPFPSKNLRTSADSEWLQTLFSSYKVYFPVTNFIFLPQQKRSSPWMLIPPSHSWPGCGAYPHHSRERRLCSRRRFAAECSPAMDRLAPRFSEDR